MKLEEIQQSWEKDCIIDRSELGEESLKIPKLHSKYFNMFSTERMLMRKMESDLKKLYRIKYEYYSGTIDLDTLKEYNWEPNPLKILRSDIAMYMDSDKEYQTLQLKYEYQKEKVEFIENIIKSLTNRGYQIKSAIDWEKFKVGA
jgi:hypothetical protein